MLLYGWLQDAVKGKGGAKALIYRDTYLSWRGLLHRVDRRADEFASTGIRAGDFVGLMLGNVPDFVIMALALSKLRAAPLPLDPTTSTRELEMLMATVPLRGLVTRPRGGDAPIPGAPGDGEKRAPTSRKRLQGTLLSCSIYDTEPRTVPRKKGEQIAAVLITTDSAGDPKPVERTADNLAAEGAHLTEALKLTPDDRVLLTMPLFQAFGFDVGIAGTLASGAAMYLEDEIAANRVMRLVREQKITVLPGSATLFMQLARLPATRPLAHKPVRMLSLNGGLTDPLLDAFKQRYGVVPRACYHSAETGTVSIDPKGQAGETVGKPLPSVETRIVQRSGAKPAGVGKPGSLWVRSATVSPLKLYAHATSNSKEVPVGGTDKEGWYRTGDLAAADRGGRIRLHGREDDLVPIEGKRVALGEVEGCIETYPRVSAAQATVITDPLGGPMVVAKVVAKGGRIDPEAVIDHCARNLAPYKVPRRIEICEAL